MIPDTCPDETKSSAERSLFDALRQKLGSDYVVIHSLPWLHETRQALREGECDFLVLHPGRGLLALEVKSGEFRYHRSTAAWVRDDGSSSKDPFLQAQSSAHHLNELLLKKVPAWKAVRPPFGHAVGFPEARKIEGSLAPHMTADIIILEQDLRGLAHRIEEIYDVFHRPFPALSDQAMKSVVDTLLPEFRLARSLVSELNEQRGQLFRLTDEQVRVLEALDANPRLIVRGCAGSGKTVVAMERAARLARAGARVLFLCFTTTLVPMIRERLVRAHAEADVHTFHGLCRRLITETGGVWAVPEGDAERVRQFFSNGVVDLVLSALPEYSRRYDAILVDEGQDFADTWWIPLLDLQAEPASSRLYVFYDPTQNIFKRAPALPFEGPIMDLLTNFRNTRRIGEWLHGVLGLKYHVDVRIPMGSPPEICTVATREAEWEAVRQLLHLLIHEHHLGCDQVVILGRHRLERSAFADRRHLGNVEVIDIRDTLRPNCVRYSTVHSFKGLEADCVVLTGVGEPSETVGEEEERALVYVGASRARLRLYVFQREGSFLRVT